MPNLDATWVERQLGLCEKATVGPWEEYADEVIAYLTSHTICAFLQSNLPKVERMDNAAFIAAAREGYPLALNALQSLRKQVRQFLESHSFQYYEAGYWIVGDSALSALDRAMKAADASTE